MSPAILAVLFSAFLHPIVGIFVKKANHPLTLNFWGVILAGIFFSYHYWDIDFWNRVVEHRGLLIISGLIHSFYVYISYTLIVKHDFQILYPLTRLAPILVLVGEMAWFGTEFTFFQILGVIILVLGSLIFGLDKKISHVRGSILFQIFLIAVIVASYHLVDKKLLVNFSPSEMWALITFQLPLLALPILNKREDLKKDLKNWKSLVGYTVCMVGTWYGSLFALARMDAAIVSSVRNLSIIFGVFLGAQVFKEGHKPLKYIGAIFICLGAFFVLT